MHNDIPKSFPWHLYSAKLSQKVDGTIIKYVTGSPHSNATVAIIAIAIVGSGGLIKTQIVVPFPLLTFIFLFPFLSSSYPLQGFPSFFPSPHFVILWKTRNMFIVLLCLALTPKEAVLAQDSPSITEFQICLQNRIASSRLKNSWRFWGGRGGGLGKWRSFSGLECPPCQIPFLIPDKLIFVAWRSVVLSGDQQPLPTGRQTYFRAKKTGDPCRFFKVSI